MNNYQDKLNRFVLACIKNENCFILDRLQEYLENYDMRNGYSRVVSDLQLPFDIEIILYEMLKEAYSKKLNSTRVIEDISLSSTLAIRMFEEQPSLSSVWTGPLFDRRIMALKTYETVKDLIDSAQNDILIVGYSFSFKYEEVLNVLKSIENAVKRKCNVNFIVNKKESNLREIVSNWKEEKHKLNIFQWKGSPEKDFTSLHAKLIIVDQREMLITSANFSYHGFKKNIETGVLIGNHTVVSEIRNQYLSLIRNNHLERYF